MRVVVFSQNNPGVYSGGRYHALMLAEALAHGGHDVHYITNALPVFFKDFEAFPHHTRIRTTITENFVVDLAGEEIDAIVVTPGRSDHPVYYNAARMAALWSGAQIFLINFESGNWFNSLAPEARDLGNWDHWKRVIEYGGTVLSSAQESEDWAKRFYVEHPETTNFAVWSPPINSAAADSVSHVEKENRAVIISRLSDPHKGMDAILDILPDEMAGWALTIISGTPDVDERFLSDLRAMAQTRDISLDFSFRPNDAQKFYELKRAKLMIFPSLFEGYGYPPLEALYCNTDVVAYDLPVVRETSGAGPYYAAHGDKSALKAALREALLDPALGTRNHHQTVRDLVHMDSAAERLTALLKQETTDARRTTQVRFEAPPPPTASERLTGAMPGPLRRFVQKQGVRWTRLKTREGRRSYAKRLAQMAAPATRETKQARLDLTAATVDEMGVISIRGWRLGGQKADKIEARIGDRLVIPGQVGLARPDLAVKYPQYNDPNAGWEVTGRFMDEDVLGQPVDVLFYGGDTLLGRVGSTMAPAPSNAIHWQARREAEAGAARGRLCLILADLEDALIGAPGLHDLKNLAAALKYGGTPSILLLNGEELDAEGQIKHLKGLFDEVLLADPTKPALKPHQPPHLPNHLAALEKALHQIQNSRLLASAVAVGPQLVDALTILNPDIRRGVYLPMAMGDQLPSMNRLALISPDHSTVSAALEAGQDGLHLPLSSLAYGTPQEPIYGTSTLLVPAMGHGLSIEAARALTEDLAVGSSKQPTLIQALLQRGEPITAPFEHANARIEPLAPAEDSATYYANAALVVVPAIEALKTPGTQAILRRSLMQACASGRSVFIDQEALLAPLHDQGVKTFSDRASLASAVLARLDAAAIPEGQAHTPKPNPIRPDPSAIYGPVSSWFSQTNLPRSFNKALASDARIQQAVDALMQAQPSFGSQATAPKSAPLGSVRVCLGQDLATANAVIAGLRARKITIEGFHAADPQHLKGLLAEDRDITPLMRANEPYVLATLDPMESVGLASRLALLNTSCLPLRPMMTPFDHQGFQKLWASAADRIVNILGQGGDEGGNSAEQTDHTATVGSVNLASAGYILNNGDRPDVLGKVDVLVSSDPALGPAAAAIVRRYSPQATIIIARHGGAFRPPLTGPVLTLDLSTPPWTEDFEAQFSDPQTEGSNRLLHLIRAWLLGTSTPGPIVP